MLARTQHHRFFSYLILIFLLLIASPQAHAVRVLFEGNVFYFSGALTNTTTTSQTRSVYAGALSFALDKKSTFLLGWNYVSAGSNDNNGTTTTTWASNDMGPKLIWVIDKDRTWSFGASYNLLANATYSSGGGTSEKWRGTSYLVELGYAPLAGEDFNAGLKLNYYSASYSEKLVGSNTYSTVAITQTFLFPSLFFSYLF